MLFTERDLYSDAVRVDRWKRSILNRLEKKNMSYIFSRAISYYLMEITNFPDDLQNIYAGLLRYLSLKTHLGIQELSDLMLSKQQDVEIKNISSSATETKFNEIITVKIGELSQTIPKERYLMLNNGSIEPTESLRLLILRYHMLDLSTGYFWSMDPKIYRSLESELSPQFTDEQLPTLECFGSPFNFAVNNFCSLFSGDREEISYPEGVECLGNFFDYIKRLKSENVAARMLFNPPYTQRMLKKSIELLIDYMNSVEYAEVVALVPFWPDFDPITSLISLKGSEKYKLEEKKYEIYDYVKNEKFSPHGTSLLLIVNVNQNASDSRELLDYIKRLIE